MTWQHQQTTQSKLTNENTRKLVVYLFQWFQDSVLPEVLIKMNSFHCNATRPCPDQEIAPGKARDSKLPLNLVEAGVISLQRYLASREVTTELLCRYSNTPIHYLLRMLRIKLVE